jgi:lipopolysaccharide export LptBFGC system permease protein LptF
LLDRYLLRLIAEPIYVVAGVILIAALLSSRVAPEAAFFVVALALSTRVLVIYTRLSQRGELLAMQAGGISLFRASAVPFVLGCAFMAGLYAFFQTVKPSEDLRHSIGRATWALMVVLAPVSAIALSYAHRRQTGEAWGQFLIGMLGYTALTLILSYVGNGIGLLLLTELPNVSMVLGIMYFYRHA